jgi:hypothetical protein
MHFIHGDDIDVERAKMRQHRAQEFRFDLEVMVGLELGIAPRPDVMQHENGADACEDWSQQKMRTREVKRFQPGADNGVSELVHQGRGAGRLEYGSKLANER